MMERKCNKCGIVLNDDNWRNSCRLKHDYICKKCYNERQRKFYENHKEEQRKQSRKNYRKYYSYYQDYAKTHKGNLEKYRLGLRLKVIEKFGGKCANPFNIDHTSFEMEPDYIYCLQIDHVNGGGKKEHNRYKSGTSYLKKVLVDTEGKYQLLCANCNWIKRHRKNE